MKILLPTVLILCPLFVVASWVEFKSGTKAAAAATRLANALSQEHVDGLNDALFRFSLAVLRQSGNQTAVFSPFSTALALSMLNVGANGKTSDEISKLLFDYDGEDYSKIRINVFLKEHSEILNNYTNGTLKIASAIYVEKAIGLLEGYQKTLKAVYEAKIEKVDFAKDPQAQRVKINQFVNATTEGHIPEFAKKPDITSATQLVAVNSIFLKSTFKQPFSTAQTRKVTFHNDDQTTKQVEMMKDTKSGSFSEARDFLYAAIPLAEMGFEIFIIVPQTMTLAELTTPSNRYLEHRSGYPFAINFVSKLHISMPKIKINRNDGFASLLKKLGIKEMFTQKADFSGISKAKFHIDDIIQQAVFDLDERGVNAAVASIADALESELCTKNCEKTIVADRPFLFGVNYDDVPLFVGQYYG